MPRSPLSKVSKPPAPPSSGHGGHRANSGRDPAPYLRKNVTIELPEPLIDKWDAHCADKHLSRADSLAKWLRWKKPGKKK